MAKIPLRDALVGIFPVEPGSSVEVPPVGEAEGAIVPVAVVLSVSASNLCAWFQISRIGVICSTCDLIRR